MVWKSISSFIFIQLIISSCLAQVMILSHNDYQKPQPLITALSNQANIIEADVFPVNGKILVAHEAREVVDSLTLEYLYLRPLVSRMEKNKGHVSTDTSYHISLMIDIKRDFNSVMSLLIPQLQIYGYWFDRSRNPHAIQIVISGDRGDPSKWPELPKFIYFDGRPFETYTAEQLERVAFISDNYWKYVNRGNSNLNRLEKVNDQIRSRNKLSRFWGAPDTEESWSELIKIGVGIISSDNVAACRKWLSSTYGR